MKIRRDITSMNKVGVLVGVLVGVCSIGFFFSNTGTISFFFLWKGGGVITFVRYGRLVAADSSGTLLTLCQRETTSDVRRAES